MLILLFILFSFALGNSSKTTIKHYLFMEIRLFRSLENMAQGKHFLCVRVENPDAFEFDKTLSVFRTLYGSEIVFVVIAV